MRSHRPASGTQVPDAPGNPDRDRHCISHSDLMALAPDMSPAGGEHGITRATSRKNADRRPSVTPHDKLEQPRGWVDLSWVDNANHPIND